MMQHDNSDSHFSTSFSLIAYVSLFVRSFVSPLNFWAEMVRNPYYRVEKTQNTGDAT